MENSLLVNFDEILCIMSSIYARSQWENLITYWYIVDCSNDKEVT